VTIPHGQPVTDQRGDDAVAPWCVLAQPGGSGNVTATDWTVAHRVDEPTAVEPVGVFEPTLGAGPRRAAGCRISAPVTTPTATVRDGAYVTLRRPGGAHLGTKVHQGLVPVIT